MKGLKFLIGIGRVNEKFGFQALVAQQNVNGFARTQHYSKRMNCQGF